MKPNKTLMLLSIWFSAHLVSAPLAGANEIDLAKMAENDAKLESMSDDEKIQQLQSDIQQLKEWIATAKSQQQGLQGELQLSEEDIASLIQRIEDVKASIRDSEQQLADLDKQKKN